MSTRTEHARHHTQILGAVGLAIIVTICGLLIATYQRAFADVVMVTVESDRAGLLLDEGARVRMSGVPVGEVRSTAPTADGKVRIEIALDADKADLIPADVVASLRATTAFGSKFVDLRSADGGSAGATIEAGAVISTDGVTVEANDVFQHGIDVLTAVDPVSLNSSLNAAATALDGRGEKFGQFFSDWDTYLKALDPHLGTLEDDLSTAPTVLDTYADAAPKLIDTGDNFAVTSGTLTQQQGDLESALRGTVKGAESASRLLRALHGPLASFNRQWLPVTRLVAGYSQNVGCIIDGLNEHVRVFSKFFGNPEKDEHYFYAKTGFLPGMEPYTLEENRPKLVSGIKPTCYRSGTAQDPTVAHVNFDDGTKDVYEDANTDKPVGLAEDPVEFYGDLVHDWFGYDALGNLLGGGAEGSGQ